jgi:hypothetical protein
VFKVAGKIFALSRLDRTPLGINLKCEPELAEHCVRPTPLSQAAPRELDDTSAPQRGQLLLSPPIHCSTGGRPGQWAHDNACDWRHARHLLVVHRGRLTRACGTLAVRRKQRSARHRYMAAPDARDMFRFVDWPFPDGEFPSHLGAVVMKSVLGGERPALHVVHLPDNGWAVADGIDDPNEEGATTVAHMHHLVTRDPALAELAALPPGCVADRQHASAPWVISRFEWEPD